MNDVTDAVDISRRPLWRRLMRMLLILCALVVVVLFGLILLQGVSLEKLISMRATIDRWNIVLASIRIPLLIALIAFWHPINRWLGAWRGWDDDQLQRVLSGRWTVAAVILFVEGILIQQLHQPLIDALTR